MKIEWTKDDRQGQQNRSERPEAESEIKQGASETEVNTKA